MSRTIIQQARANSKLRYFHDTRGGNLRDQSGDGLAITVPSDAHFHKDGLRCFSNPASVPLDLSGTQNICMFALVTNWQASTLVQSIAELTANVSINSGGAQLYQAANENLFGLFNGNGGNPFGAQVYDKRTDSYFFSVHFDRRLTEEPAKSYYRGVGANSFAGTNSNDDSNFANSVLYLMARFGPSQINSGLLPVCGVVDFGPDSDYQWTPEQQIQLYTEIRDRKTI